MPAPWKPNLTRSPDSCTPEVPKSWSSSALADEDSAAFCRGLPDGSQQFRISSFAQENLTIGNVPVATGESKDKASDPVTPSPEVTRDALLCDVPATQPYCDGEESVPLATDITSCEDAFADTASTQLCDDVPSTQVCNTSAFLATQLFADEANEFPIAGTPKSLGPSRSPRCSIDLGTSAFLATQLFADEVPANEFPTAGTPKALGPSRSPRCSINLGMSHSTREPSRDKDAAESESSPAVAVKLEAPAIVTFVEQDSASVAAEPGTSSTATPVVQGCASVDADLENPSTVTPVRPARVPCQRDGDSVAKGRIPVSQTYGSQSSTATNLGHTLSPVQQGSRVAVVGDGWGSGEGGYEGVVTEADHYTFTVIATSGDHPWTENHVLKEHCIFLSEASKASTKTARKNTATSKASSKRQRSS